MLEFIFFNDDLRGEFEDFVQELELESEARVDTLGTVVMLPEDMPEETIDQLEDKYAELMEQQATLSDESEEVPPRQSAGIRVTMTDGSQRMIPLDPEMLNRLLESLSLEEIQELVNAIAIGLEKGKDSLCQR